LHFAGLPGMCLVREICLGRQMFVFPFALWYWQCCWRFFCQRRFWKSGWLRPGVLEENCWNYFEIFKLESIYSFKFLYIFISLFSENIFFSTVLFFKSYNLVELCLNVLWGLWYKIVLWGSWLNAIGWFENQWLSMNSTLNTCCKYLL